MALAAGVSLARSPQAPDGVVAQTSGAPTLLETAAVQAHHSRTIDPAVRLDLRSARATAITGQVDNEPVTLLVAAAPSDDRAASRKRPSFRANGNLKVWSWSRAGQSFALVSALPGMGQAACRLCHTSGAEALLGRSTTL